MGAVVTYFMNIMNQEIALNKTDSDSLKLCQAHKEICYYVNSYITKKDIMAAELLCFIHMYLIKPCKGNIMVTNQDPTNADDIRQKVARLEKEYGVVLEVHSELDDYKWILHIHAACVADYMAIKRRLKGKEVSQ